LLHEESEKAETAKDRKEYQMLKKKEGGAEGEKEKVLVRSLGKEGSGEGGMLSNRRL
jgi:hypothetical protein